MAGINTVSLTGRLTRDVELRKTKNDTPFASVTVAVDRYVKNKDGNQQTADFINVIVWKQSASYLAEHAGKGTMIGVEGRLQSRSYENQAGQKVNVTEVAADNVYILCQPQDSSQKPVPQMQPQYGTSAQAQQYTPPQNNFYGGYNPVY